MNANARKVLQHLARNFKKEHHGLVSQLAAYKVPVIGLLDFSKSGMARGLSAKPPLEEVIIDLRNRGHLSLADASYVSLTELGFKEGSRGILGRLWDFINHSPGIAILISLGSLIVSLTSLMVTVIALQKH